MEFSTLDLPSELLGVLTELGYAQMTPIQAKALPPLLAGDDVIGQSKTGSGKTAAFALPILSKLKVESRELQALILCPTRELAAQVTAEIRKLGRKIEGLQVLSLTGGQPGREQAESLSNGTHIAVGTPGRVLDHINRERIDLFGIKTLVLDEADKMLEMGFADELKAIIQELPQKRQTALFSATFQDSILDLTRRYQKNPQHVTIEEGTEATAQIQQVSYECAPEDKTNTLMRILQQHPANSTIIFCNTKAAVNELLEKISEQEVSCASLHGDLEQRERDRVMTLFRNGSHRILIATDVAARGLDIENLELVVNYDLPIQAETYLHRIGRTGRAGRSGTAVVICDKRDALKILELEKMASAKFERPTLGFKNQFGLNKSLRTSVMQTLSISGGRKDKLRPGDILGALTSEGSKLTATDIGKIEIQDKYSYVAISSQAAKSAFEKLRDGKIKGRKFQIKILNE